MNIEEFIENQNQVYDKIREKTKWVRREGIRPSPALQNRVGGFFITLIHHPAVVDRATLLSKNLANVIPAIIYHKEHLHTTLGRCREFFGPQFYFNSGDRAKRQVLENLCAVTRKCVGKVAKAPIITFGEYLVSEHSVIASGQPDDSFFDLALDIQAQGKEYGLEIDIPWGAHMTVSRFTESVAADKLRRFWQILEALEPLGQSRTIAICAGYTLRTSIIERHAVNLQNTPGHFFCVEKFLFSS